MHVLSGDQHSRILDPKPTSITVVTETVETKLLKNGMLKLKNNTAALEFLLFPYAQT
jgi:hypothetical protein